LDGAKGSPRDGFPTRGATPSSSDGCSPARLTRRREAVAEILNLQPRPDGTAKPYQVRQVRDILVTYGLAGEASAEEAE
jgi:hypothetical protein